MKHITLGLFAATALLGAASTVDVYSPKDLQATKAKLAEGHPAFKSESFKNYGNHYTMLAYREASGSAELHEHEADILVFQDGEGTLITGGKLVDQHTEKPGEIRAKSITGGEKHPFGPGYVIHVPAGVPHQVVLEKGKTVSYFVVKVTGQ
jgi:mannose-6-phosphate isomerase-like protein (cupin superfamily)